MNAMANGMDGAGKIRCLQRHNESRNITLRVRLAKLRHNTDNDTVSFINGRTADIVQRLSNVMQFPPN